MAVSKIDVDDNYKLALPALIDAKNKKTIPRTKFITTNNVIL